MPSFVISDKCDGCKGRDRTACEYICPNDLMVLGPTKETPTKESTTKTSTATGGTAKAFNRAPDMCWECYSCVKTCPVQAIDVRGYADFVPLGASCVPLRGSEDILWVIKFRNGSVKRFKFPIRTTPEGSAVPDGGFGLGSGDLNDSSLFTEPASLRLASVPKFQK